MNPLIDVLIVAIPAVIVGFILFVGIRWWLDQTPRD